MVTTVAMATVVVAVAMVTIVVVVAMTTTVVTVAMVTTVAMETIVVAVAMAIFSICGHTRQLPMKCLSVPSTSKMKDDSDFETDPFQDSGSSFYPTEDISNDTDLETTDINEREEAESEIQPKNQKRGKNA
ncbi:hypothetical protein FQR65_LT09172 [Abscondita terminalis]|nr:hypothetical protein FQR65_LT09172 [Abscondita terminalis]